MFTAIKHVNSTYVFLLFIVYLPSPTAVGHVPISLRLPWVGSAPLGLVQTGSIPISGYMFRGAGASLQYTQHTCYTAYILIHYTSRVYKMEVIIGKVTAVQFMKKNCCFFF